MANKYQSRRRMEDPPKLPRRSWEEVSPRLWAWLRKIHERLEGGIPGGFNNTTPTTVAVGGTASPGNESAGWMAADAALIVAAGTALGLANANANGTGATASRGDHQHKRDVRVRLNGSDVGTRNALNFTTGFAAADDVGNDEVDIAAVPDSDQVLLAASAYLEHRHRVPVVQAGSGVTVVENALGPVISATGGAADSDQLILASQVFGS